VSPAAERYESPTEIPNSHYTKTILKGPFLCFSFAHPFVRRSIHKRLPCVRQKPLFNCVGVVHSFGHVYILIIHTRIRIMLWLCFLSELYACFVLIPHRVQVHKERRHIHLYAYCEAARSSKQLTKFCDVSPTEASELLRTHIVRFPLTMLLKALLNKFSSSHCAFERFHVKTSHVNINYILYSQKL
jgi:hypothetical protein